MIFEWYLFYDISYDHATRPHHTSPFIIRRGVVITLSRLLCQRPRVQLFRLVFHSPHSFQVPLLPFSIELTSICHRVSTEFYRAWICVRWLHDRESLLIKALNGVSCLLSFKFMWINDVFPQLLPWDSQHVCEGRTRLCKTLLNLIIILEP